MAEEPRHDPTCPRLCPLCADKRDIAERVLRIVEANRIRDTDALEWIDGAARDAGADYARKAIERYEAAVDVPF